MVYREYGMWEVLEVLRRLHRSRHMYVHITWSQALDDVIHGLEAAWESFGGVTAQTVFDNLKAAVVKADRYEPAFQRTFSEYAEHRGVVIDSAVAYHHGKGTAEGMGKLPSITR